MNPYLKQNKTYPSDRLSVLLEIDGARLVVSDILRSEFESGRVPIYCLRQEAMTDVEKAFLPKDCTIWITKKISPNPIRHTIKTSGIRTVFNIWFDDDIQKKPKKSKLGLLEPIADLSTITNCTHQDAILMSKCLLFARLMGFHGEFPHSKLFPFDQGIVYLKPLGLKIQKNLYEYAKKERSKLQKKLTLFTIKTLNHFFITIKDHPDFEYYKPLIELHEKNWRAM